MCFILVICAKLGDLVIRPYSTLHEHSKHFTQSLFTAPKCRNNNIHTLESNPVSCPGILWYAGWSSQ